MSTWSGAACATAPHRPGAGRPQAGLVTSGVLVLASLPVLYGVGRGTQPGNTSVLPGNYPLALAGVLLLVWLGVGALGALGASRRRGQPR